MRLAEQVLNYPDVYGRTVAIDCVLGIPGLSLPIGLAADSMPIGIMFHGLPGAFLHLTMRMMHAGF